MGNKIFVGNLPFSATDDKLKELFSQFGDITEAVIIKNKFSGRSKGFGFVTFGSEADAQKAVAEMNEKEVEGRKITVKEATPFNPDAPRPRRSFGDRGSGGFGGQRRGGFGGRREGGFGGGRGRFNKRESSDDSDDSQQEGY